jgi:hypothetical protein
MKKTLFSFLLLVSVSIAFAQAPCPEALGAGTNMGGGDCQECVGTANNAGFDFSQKATAKVVIEFNEVLPCVPRLLSITKESGVTIQADCGVGQIKQGAGNSTLVEYCFWGNDEFFRSRTYLSATIKYECSNLVRNCPLDGSEQIPLPVHFKSFNASRTTTSNISITWTTASEQNNRGFNVQKNVGSGWKTVAFVFSQTEDGNSYSDLSYSFKDVNNEKGITQYRIQQVDMDNRVAYTDIRAIRGEATNSKIVVYPNPSVDGKVNVVFEDNTVRDIQVNDMQGKVIKS